MRLSYEALNGIDESQQQHQDSQPDLIPPKRVSSEGGEHCRAMHQRDDKSESLDETRTCSDKEYDNVQYHFGAHIHPTATQGASTLREFHETYIT